MPLALPLCAFCTKFPRKILFKDAILFLKFIWKLLIWTVISRLGEAGRGHSWFMGSGHEGGQLVPLCSGLSRLTTEHLESWEPPQSWGHGMVGHPSVHGILAVLPDNCSGLLSSFLPLPFSRCPAPLPSTLQTRGLLMSLLCWSPWRQHENQTLQPGLGGPAWSGPCLRHPSLYKHQNYPKCHCLRPNYALCWDCPSVGASA